ncbi:Na(+)/H(+) antiporter subunit D [Alphaproteobacteria bacterium]|nr:Na(+)/H(+) antiporter subunit D [Alphaproteobacteria bacterium]
MNSVLPMFLSLPGVFMLLGAIFVPLLPHALRQIWMLAIIGVSAWLCWGLTPGVHLTTQIAGLDLILVRAHAITLPFSVVFHIAAALNVIYAMHERSRTTATAGLAYAGAAIAALYAGDFITLFVYWELTAFTSVFLILVRRSETSLGAAMRYLLMQVSSGVILLAGAVLLWHGGQGLQVQALNASSLAGGLILLAFGIKAAFPFLNGWLQDAYPEASVTGTVMLSAFTTKLAIYMLALCFAGTPMLIWIGVAMALFPVFFAIIENDLRRVLAFSLNSQLGFMVVGVGIGTELALNGTISHAFASTIYKGLLFMAMGAVLHRTGTAKASELGGLWRQMPLTLVFCTLGALSIVSFPLFSGFVTKSLTLGAVAKQGYIWVWMLLIFASVGVFAHIGLKVIYSAFFASGAKFEVKEAPVNMLVAMGIAAALCVGIGVAPHWLYGLLPYEVSYDAWKIGHVLGELQLLAFATLGAALCMVLGLYKRETDSTILNTDWLARGFALPLILRLARPVLGLWFTLLGAGKGLIMGTLQQGERASQHSGLVSGVATTGAAAGIFLCVFSLLLALLFWM